MQTEKKSFKTVLAVIGNVLLWAFLIFSMLITIMVFSAQNSPDGIPSIFGKSLLTVATDSMHPTFNAGDLIIMDKMEQSEVPSLQVGDIITYRAPIDMNGDGMTGDINTHRILEIDEEKKEFITKGDNNAVADNIGEYSHTVSYHAVVGKYSGTRLAGVGKVLAFLRTSLGFFLCVVLPLIFFFLYELYVFISVIVTEKMKKKAEAEPQLDEEEIKRKAIEEYLAQQAAANAEAAKPAEAPAEAVKEQQSETSAQEEKPAEEAESAETETSEKTEPSEADQKEEGNSEEKTEEAQNAEKPSEAAAEDKQ